MKKSVVFLMIFLLSVCCVTANAQESEYTILNDTFVRPLGRTEVSSKGRSMNFPSSGISFSFSGTKAEIHVSHESGGISDDYDENYFTVVVDGQKVDERLTLPKTGWFTIAENLENTEHTIQIRRSDEGARGRVWVDNIRVDSTNGVYPTQMPERRIEFIGDSYTVGYGNLPMGIDNEGRYGKNGDNYYTYAAYTARHYNADYQIVAYSGKGAYVNYQGSDTANEISSMLKYADVKVDGDSTNPGDWDYSSYRPQIVTVFLGTNDEHGISVQDETERAEYENNFSNTYTNMIKGLREKYPVAHIILISKPSGCMKEEIDEIYSEISTTDKYIHRFVFDSFPVSGIHSHPNISEHKAMSDKLIEFIDTLEDDFGKDLWKGEVRLQTDVDVSDGTVKVTLNGNRVSDKLSIFVTKPGTAQSKLPGVDDIVYVNQVIADDRGIAEFSFKPESYSGMYNISVGFENSISKLTDTFSFTKFIPKITVKRGEEAIKKVEQLKSGDKLTVNLDVENTENKNYDGIVFCTQYNDGKLIDVKAADINYDNTESQSVSLDFTVGEINYESILRIMFWENGSLNPLMAVYEIAN